MDLDDSSTAPKESRVHETLSGGEGHHRDFHFRSLLKTALYWNALDGGALVGGGHGAGVHEARKRLPGGLGGRVERLGRLERRKPQLLRVDDAQRLDSMPIAC